MAKEYKYRGKTLEELKQLSLKEFSEMLPAKQRRKIKRGFTEQEKQLVDKLRVKSSVKTHSRELIILPEMVGKIIMVHNGKSFETVRVQEDMIGHCLGEFSMTRKKTSHNAPGVGATKSSSSISVR